MRFKNLLFFLLKLFFISTVVSIEEQNQKCTIYNYKDTSMAQLRIHGFRSNLPEYLNYISKDLSMLNEHQLNEVDVMLPKWSTFTSYSLRLFTDNVNHLDRYLKPSLDSQFYHVDFVFVGLDLNLMSDLAISSCTVTNIELNLSIKTRLSNPASIHGSAPDKYIFVGGNSDFDRHTSSHVYEDPIVLTWLPRSSFWTGTYMQPECTDLDSHFHLVTSYMIDDQKYYYTELTNDCADFMNIVNFLKNEVDHSLMLSDPQSVVDLYGDFMIDVINNHLTINYLYEKFESINPIRSIPSKTRLQSSVHPEPILTDLIPWVETHLNLKTQVLWLGLWMYSFLPAFNYDLHYDLDLGFVKNMSIDITSQHIGNTTHRIIGNTFSVFQHKTGVVTVDHGDQYNDIKSFVNERNSFVLTERNIDSDYRFYGQRPYIGSATRTVNYMIKGTRYYASVFATIGLHHYAISFAKPVAGASGSAIFNDKGHFISVYSESRDFFSEERININDLDKVNDLTIFYPIILRFPHIPPTEAEPFEVNIPSVKLPQVTMFEDLPHEPGCYELTARMGSGKSTLFPTRLVDKGFSVLMTEPYINLALAVANRNNFKFLAGGKSSSNVHSDGMVMTAGSLNHLIWRQQIQILKDYDVILVDEDHSENADTMFLKQWFTQNAAAYGLLVYFMSATHPNSLMVHTKHHISDVTIQHQSDLSNYLSPNVNALLFSPTKENSTLVKLAEQSNMKVIKYNADTIKDNPNSVIDMMNTLANGKGYAVIATKIAEMGFNASVDLVYTSDEDITEIVKVTPSQGYSSSISRIKISYPNYVQRRGRVGRNYPGTFIFQGIKPTAFYNPNTIDQFRADMRMESLGLPRHGSLFSETYNLMSDYGSIDNRMALWNYSWADDLTSLYTNPTFFYEDDARSNFEHQAHQKMTASTNVVLRELKTRRSKFTNNNIETFFIRNLFYPILSSVFYNLFIYYEDYPIIPIKIHPAYKLDLGPMKIDLDKTCLDVTFNDNTKFTFVSMTYTDFTSEIIPLPPQCRMPGECLLQGKNFVQNDQSNQSRLNCF